MPFPSHFIWSFVLGGSFVFFPLAASSQELRLKMVHDALAQVHDKYVNATNKQGLGSPNRANPTDPETDPRVLDAKARIIGHAFTSSRKANGKVTPINDNVTNKISPASRRRLTTQEVCDAALNAIEGTEADLQKRRALLNKSGGRAPLFWSTVNPADGDNRILLTIADQPDRFRRDFDDRAGTDALRATVPDEPAVDGASFRQSTLSIHKEMRKFFFSRYSELTNLSKDPDLSLVTRYTDARGRPSMFWNEQSLAGSLPEAIDAVAQTYAAEVARAEAANPARGEQADPPIPDDRRWQAFQNMTDSEFGFLRRNWDNAMSRDQDLTSYVAQVDYSTPNPNRFDIDRLDQDDDTN